MSSPFSLLRKHQKFLLAFFGVLIMITFVVGDIVVRYQTRSRDSTAQQAVVVWKGGKITENELIGMRNAHAMAIRFLDSLVQRTLAEKGTPKGPGVTRDQNGMIRDPGIPRSFAEEDLVQTELLAQEAEGLGIDVSDEAIEEFLDQLSDDVVPRREYAKILHDASQGRSVKQHLFEQLRKELLAQNVRIMAQSGLFAITPGTAWDYYNRLNRRVKAEVLPLKVADYVSKVDAEPSEAEVQKLYQEAKDRFPNPSSPEPGFKRRHKIAFQYVKAEFEKFLDKEKANITPEQVAKYYEENKKNFVAPELPPAEDTSEKPKEKSPAEDGMKPESKPEATSEGKPAEKTEAQPDAKPEAKPEPKTETKPEAKPESKSDPQPEAKPEPKPESKPESKPEAKPEPKPESKPESKPEKSSAVPMARDAFYVSVLNAEDSGSEAAETPKPAAEPAKPDAASATEKSAEPKGKDGEKSAPTAAPPSEKPATDSPAKPGSEEKPAEQPGEKPGAGAKAEEKPVKYKPLAEVADQIRGILARPEAQKKQDLAFKAVQREIDKYFRERMKWVSQSKSDPEAKEPAAPDHIALAEKEGLIGGDTPLADELQITDYELGRAYTFTIANRQVQTIPFTRIAYAQGIPLYKPDQIRSFMADEEFLFWKVKEEQAVVPELKDIQDEVVQVWKMRRALGLAREEAERWAKQVRRDQPLKDTLDKDQAEQVVETNEFTWMTRGSTPTGSGMPYLSVVTGVDNPGPDFMQAVFALPLGQATAAVNRPQTMVYVVRLISESPPEEERRKRFLETGITFDTFQMAAADRQQLVVRWFQDLEQEKQLKWNRPPQRFTASEE